jgi:Tol biopolymer transport system component
VTPAAGETHLRNIRQITHGGDNAEAYFSADGKWLIFQRQPSLKSGCDQEYVVRIDGTGLRRISNGWGKTTCGYFYAGDDRVLYSSTAPHDSACPPPPDKSHGYTWALNPYEIFTARRDGSDLRQLTNNGAYNAESTLSPDGKRIIFTSSRDGDLELYTMNVDGTDVRRITHRLGYDGGAYFSPDGSKIVWRAWYPDNAADSADYLSLLKQHLVRPVRMELWVANADGSDARQVTDLGGANFAPYFLPDGKRIIFASNYKDPRSPDFDLYVINVDGTGLTQITTDGGFDGFPMFNKDGSKLVWVSSRGATEPGGTDVFIADWVN